MNKQIITLLFSAFALSSFATTYYVSSDGDDDHNGTSQTQAWRTIDKVNQLSNTYGPGDQILFERGGTFRGRIIVQQNGTSGSPITFGAYGSGPKPVIDGSLPITNWTNYSGNIWQATFSGPVDHVYSNGALQTLARFPNTGWLRNDIGSGTYIYDAALNQPNGYWNGAEAVIRSTMWSYDVAEITNFNGGSLSFQDIYYNLQDHEWGYFMQNKLEELDEAGEWYFNENNQTLYFWAPNNADPNNLSIEVGTEDFGIEIYWNRHDIKVEYLHFKHQLDAAVRIDGASNIDISNCRFSDLFKAISSYGNDNNYMNNLIEHSYGSAIYIIDDNSTISNNEFNDIATIPGLGESNWGYFGIRVDGDGNSVTNNRLTNVGYIGIDAKSDALIEKNYIENAMSILNDGGGIAFDQGNGMIVRDNIVVDLSGDLESAAPDFPSYYLINHGIYFGNTSNQNVIVDGNTVANCRGAGIHVDHTMLSNNNQILNNVIYNNDVQINFSDFSNSNGPGATYPYFVPNYNNVVTGNIFYSLKAEQPCMNQIMVHTAAHTDYGTFNNNFYFNPYNEQCILVTDNHAGNFEYRYSLPRWQNDKGKDLNSNASLLHLTKYEVTSVNSADLATNGNFDYNVNDWTAWPNEGQLTHDQAYLDNGSMKVYFNDNSTYDYLNLQNEPSISVANGEYYRVKFSLLSDQYGELRVGFKANSQPWNTELVHEQYFPFDNTRREVEYIFQSDIDDNGRNHFFNDWDESTYWIDNMEMHQVSVVELDPTEKSVLIFNDQGSTQTIPLNGCYSDVNGALYSDDITVQPFSSVVLVKEEDPLCGLSTGIEESNSEPVVSLYPSPVNGSGDVRIQGVTGRSQIEVYSTGGAKVLSASLSNGDSFLSLPGLPSGIYLVEVINSTNRYTTKLVVN